MSQTPQSVTVRPAARIRGTVEVPGDKSISHRMAMVAGIASGTSTIRNFLQSEDCLNTLRAMEALGARTFLAEDGSLGIQGTGGKLIEPAGVLDVGNSGTTIRLLAGLIAGQAIAVELTGDESLRSRPMGRIRDPLEKMGAKVELTGEKGLPPIRIQGGNLKAIDYVLPVASAQVKSCVLLASLYAEGVTTITEPVPTRDHTERLLRTVGVSVEVDGMQIRVAGFGPKGPSIKARPFVVPGDFSSAAFWMLAAAAMPGSEVTLSNVGLNPRRKSFLQVLRNAGAEVVERVSPGTEDAEPVGEVIVRGGSLRGVSIGGADIANLIDEIPLVAALGAMAEGETMIRDAAELRVKEADRIAAMVANLRLLGTDVEEKADGMMIRGPSPLKPSGALRSHGDHRIAMAMAVLGTRAQEPVTVTNVICINTSYPGFWQDMKRLGVQIE
jgi:3-phosphoshikimate 1-carboxyvinyltransferase